ncbi:MAG: hypothetical protein JW395_3664 [Nitrospira sp.]|nr:hypothetical protein [Nitrospira sp.]
MGGLLFKIMNLRAYAKAKQAYDDGQKEQDLDKRPKGPLIDLVRSVAWQINKARFKGEQT